MADVFNTPLYKAGLRAAKAAATRARNKAAKQVTVQAPPPRQQRLYQNARYSRSTADWHPQTSSADSELAQSFTTLRNRSRSLIRDNAYAKRAAGLVVNNVIGCGVGMQARVRNIRGEFREDVNEEIEEVWKEWCYADSCHTGGRLEFAAIERMNMAQVFACGEVFVREWHRPFGRSRIPYSLEIIESERLADEFISPMLSISARADIRMGVEQDPFYRPIAYWIRDRHPTEVRAINRRDEIARVPADLVHHLAPLYRWPQTRGEPWLHTVIKRLADVDGYSDAELVRAKGQSMRMGIITSPADAASGGFADEEDDGSLSAEMEPGTIVALKPGEEWTDSAPNAPNPALDPFMRYMVREIAVGADVSYASLSGDYSQSNYSSSRLALLDDRDVWRMLQAWYVCAFRQVIHSRWLSAAVLSRAITKIGLEEYLANPRKFEAAVFRPRGWSWVDPAKEVRAFKDAVRCGFSTLQDIVSQQGADIEEILEQRAEEIDIANKQGLVLDTNPAQVADSGAKQAEEKPDEEDAEDEDEEEQPKQEGRVVRLRQKQ